LWKKTNISTKVSERNESRIQMGAANSVCKLTVDTVALLEQLEPNDLDIANKKDVEVRIQTILQEYWPTCRIMPFGSSERYVAHYISILIAIITVLISTL
jgi:DNA polymerase sigma